jgi:hypothetical protein
MTACASAPAGGDARAVAADHDSPDSVPGSRKSDFRAVASAKLGIQAVELLLADRSGAQRDETVGSLHGACTASTDVRQLLSENSGRDCAASSTSGMNYCQAQKIFEMIVIAIPV